MRLKITHRTECRYDEPVNYALQRLRLVPCSGATQKVRSWTLSIEGAREEVRFSDHFEQRHAADQYLGRSETGQLRGVRRGRDLQQGGRDGLPPRLCAAVAVPARHAADAARRGGQGACGGDRRGRRYCAPAPADGRHPRTRHPGGRRDASRRRPANGGARRSVDGAGRPGDGASRERPPGSRRDLHRGGPAARLSRALRQRLSDARRRRRRRRRATPGPKRMSRAWAGSASTSPTTCRPTKPMCASQPAATIARRCLSPEFGWDRPRNGLR